jgi:hypothetical protein
MSISKEQHQINMSEYSAALGELLRPKGTITPEYFVEFGKEFAKAQEPPRAIPYHDFTIAGWASGELLPTPQAQAALIRVLEEEYAVPEETLDRLDTLYDKALDSQATQKNQPTELSHAMKHALVLSGKTQLDLARAMAARNAAWDEAREDNADKRGIARLPRTSQGIYYTLNGSTKHSPAKVFTYAIEQICKPPFSLRAIHENTLRERADELWLAAQREGNLGGLIRACRVRLSESLESFAKRIGILAGKKGFGTNAATFYWENNFCLPVGDQHESGDTLYTAMVQAMKLADVAKNGLSLSIPTPWFDKAKEDTFRLAFTRAIQQANEGLFTNELPQSGPVECPEPKDTRMRRYDGKLSNSLVNGRTNQSP